METNNPDVENEPNNPIPYNNNDDYDEDEDECRVCRGPAEEDHILYKPCKCSGSIGLTHQDCLQSWLQVQRGNGNCELCHTPFRFAPLYAAHAPQRLLFTQVLYGVLRRLVVRWLPQAVRVILAVILWLCVTPLLTAYQYHGWMHRPSAIVERCSTSWTLIVTDWASGAVVTACIIISFLALMSLADFLRVEWQQRGMPPWVPRRPQQEQIPKDNDNEKNNVDNGLWETVQQEILARPRQLRARRAAALRRTDPNDNADDDNETYDSMEDVPNSDDDSAAAEGDMLEFVPEDEVVHENIHPPPPQQQPRPDNNNNNRFFDMDADENMEVDINIALDELLGVRGPIMTVVRNVLWLLAFNAVYIGFFCFVPRTLGMAVVAGLFHRTHVVHDDTTPLLNETIATNSSFLSIVREIDAESQRQQTVFRLQDFITILLGYFICALGAWLVRSLWTVSQRFFTAMTSAGTQAGVVVEGEDVREAWEEYNRVANGPDPLGDEPGIALHVAIAVALDATVAIMKVGVLLFSKMFLLPMMLGLCLDASVATLFGCTWEERIRYAASDLFSFLLLHWVMGITFMLLVTVSVLQLREVVHPDLLSQVIRPQEPHPDLLGNLLHENATTHAKRLVVSLIIYAALWAVHIYIPTRVLRLPFLQSFLPSFRLHLNYLISPKIQVPFELIFFHLSMLGLLERYKNGLGEMQHHWLKLISSSLGIRDRLLPLGIDRNDYVGSLKVFESEKSLASFWYDLAKSDNKAEELIDFELLECKVLRREANLRTPIFSDDQQVHGSGFDFIRLPVLLPGKSMRSRSILLPTRIGKYRLERDATVDNAEECFIHVWTEKIGEPIPRPPEGWDDLGAEPPDVQGRWAYGSEKKSDVERSVACRRSFFDEDDRPLHTISMTSKIVIMLFLSWVVTTTLLGAVFFGPLFVGRFVCYILRIPEKWIHDPAAFLIGFLLIFPPTVVVARSITKTNDPVDIRIQNWIQGFHFPPWRKSLVLFETVVLFFGLSPFLLGIAYDLAFMKSLDWFAGREGWIDLHSLAACWATGVLLLYVWSFLCLRGVLTRRFRMFVVEGLEMAEEENPANARAAAWQNVGGRLRLTWQGKYGRMSQFVEIFQAVFMRWEFDRIDKTVLLHYVAIPVFLGISWITAIPMSFVYLSMWKWGSLSPIVRAVTTRVLLGSSLAVQILRIWGDQVGGWLEKVHATARDDLYLIGEVLQNFEE